jgi:REP element-mobilizing transposase RayT
MPIFRDHADYDRYLETAAAVAKVTGAQLLAYVLMPNHAHFLIEVDRPGLSSFFRRLGVRYAAYFNARHERVGHVFQDRFKSLPVETDSYFITAVTYIHMNPVKAGLSTSPTDYPWSSRGSWEFPDGVTALGRLGELADMDALRRAEAQALDSPEGLEDPFAPSSPGRSPVFEADDAVRAARLIARVRDLAELRSMPVPLRAQALRRLRGAGVPVMRIVALTGLSRRSVEALIGRPAGDDASGGDGADDTTGDGPGTLDGRA